MRRSLCVFVAALALLASSLPQPALAAKTGAAPSTSFTTFDLSGAGGSGVAYAGGALTLSGADNGTWTSTLTSVPFGAFDELVASWNATTPNGTWVTIEMSATGGGRTTKWYTMGIWTSAPIPARRTSVSAQGDADGFIAIDTFIASKKAAPITAYTLRLGLHRDAGVTASPAVRLLGAMTSMTSSYSIPSERYLTNARELSVPAYSQEIHAGEFPEYDGGGEAWCSPTSTAMILDFWHAGPNATELSSFPGPTKPDGVTPYTDPQVDYAARAVYDWNYQGAGNWPFNAAYAGSRGLNGFVTRLRSLAEAERFIAAGIPLVASVNGHLLTIVGFTPSGDVISNDPAAPSDAQVHVTIARDIFENVWLGGSAGIVYVIYPNGVSLPANVPGLPRNW